MSTFTIDKDYKQIYPVTLNDPLYFSFNLVIDW
jgi:hypothetical protein